jgi:PBP1b-binding outer membrane lipoprotein LpoB
MIGKKSLMWTSVCLIVTMFIAGCASPSAPAPVQTPVPTTIIQTIPQTTIEATNVPVITTVGNPA